MKYRDWVPAVSEDYIQSVSQHVRATSAADLFQEIESAAAQTRDIHERECFNLNPATNVMNPRAEALLASGIGTRPSLGYPRDKYETGLEALDDIEITAMALACEIFDANYAEIRVPSGAIANLYGFMALTKPGDTVIVPPAEIGGHVTHHLAGCAGLYGLKSVEAPVAADGYTVDIQALRDLAHRINPPLITIGGSLNLFEHPVREIRMIADEVGAKLLFDAAHQCGIIAGRAWKNPLAEGADLMTMSTYKSLGGPPSGLIVTNDAAIAQRLDAIAFPGMTANFDISKSAALAITLLDWRDFGADYSRAMIATSTAFAKALDAAGVDVFKTKDGFTSSHQFAINAAPYGGGQAASLRLRQAGFLTCGIGLPVASVDGDLNGIRIGTPELVRWGVGVEDIPQLAALFTKALTSETPAQFAAEVRALRESFDRLRYIHQD